MTLEQIAALHQRAVDEQNRGRPRRALALLQRARAALTELPAGPDAGRLAAAIAISVALNRAEVEGAEQGLRSIEDASRLVTELDDPGLLVRVHSQRAFILIRAGRYDLALAAFTDAEGLIAHADPNDQFAIRLNAGTLRLFEGDLRGARPALAAAVDVARRHAMALGEFKALHNLGYLDFLAGDLPRALQLMDAALALGDDLPLGIPLLDRARVLAEAGLTRAAEESLAAAAAIFRRNRLAQDLGESELERARCALVVGDVERARRHAMRARDRFRRRGNDRARRVAELVLLQGDLAAGRPGRRLVEPALRVRAELADDGAVGAARTAALIAAEAQLVAGEPAAAAATLAGMRVARSDAITARLHQRYVHARLDLARGHPGAASRRARHGLADLATYQASFGSIDLATAAAVHGRRLAELDLRIALDSGDARAVLESAERSRAVSSRLRAVRPPDDPIGAELLAELRQTVEAVRGAELVPAAAAPLHRRRAELEARIAARGWGRSGGGAVGEVVAFDALAGAMGTSHLVSFARAAGALQAVVVRDGSARLVELGDAVGVDEQVRRVRADMDVLAQPRLAGPLHGAVRASLNRSLASLDAQLLAPLGVSGRVVVVATGTLGQLPWGLLPSLRGVPVVVAPSASAWHAAHTRTRSRRRRVVAVAGPGVGRGVQEADDVARIWDGRTIERAGAREVTAALAGSRILHIAAHGVHQTENPLFSSIRLADGPLFAHELDQSAGTPEHVVLSACELGLATVRPGDEALGLTSVLLHLGTRCVVAGVARVGDEVAATAMADYHQRLRSDDDSALALAGALEAAPGMVPFVCFGATC